MTYTAQDKLDAVEREIRYRVRVYGRLVHDRKMTKEKSEREIGVMQAIAADYRALAEGERLL